MGVASCAPYACAVSPDPDPEEVAGGGRPPLCFVVMPFGIKPDGQGGKIDFNAVYEQLLAPAIREAKLEPLRADQEIVGGLIHKPMFERLIIADYAVADLTTANANVFYELGVRHAARPFSTVLVGADVMRTPFDLAPDRVLPYKLDSTGKPSDPAGDGAAIVTALVAARERAIDSPVFQLIGDLPTPDIDSLKTDVFREQARYSTEVKERLATARRDGAGALREIEQELGALVDVEAGVIVDLLISYRAVSDWESMIRLEAAMPEPLRRTKLVREQYGFALNRTGRSEDAETVLQGVIEDYGPSSETYGLLGRVFKDRWQADLENGSALRAAGHLDNAIDAYRRGFEADFRDAYPGVNAVTLMELREPGGAAQQDILPVVRYANRRRIDGGAPDYWDHATRMELAVIARDRADAFKAAAAALAAVRETWEPKTTANNLALIRKARAEHDETVVWADELESELLKAAGADG